MRILIPLVVLSILTACTSPDRPVEDDDVPVLIETESTPDLPSLQDALDERREAFLNAASPEKIGIYQRGVDEIAQSGLVERAVHVSDPAPDFTLTDAVGDSVHLSDLLADGPVVLTWYRGGWCPYCNITLIALKEALPHIEERGAALVALTPERPDSAWTTAERLAIDFTVLSDLGNEVARMYGIVFALNDTIAAMYENGFGLSSYNQNDRAELPLAATYVIDTQGIVRYAFLDADYRNRAEPSEIIEALDAL